MKKILLFLFLFFSSTLAIASINEQEVMVHKGAIICQDLGKLNFGLKATEQNDERSYKSIQKENECLILKIPGHGYALFKKDERVFVEIINLIEKNELISLSAPISGWTANHSVQDWDVWLDNQE